MILLKKRNNYSKSKPKTAFSTFRLDFQKRGLYSNHEVKPYKNLFNLKKIMNKQIILALLLTVSGSIFAAETEATNTNKKEMLLTLKNKLQKTIDLINNANNSIKVWRLKTTQKATDKIKQAITRKATKIVKQEITQRMKNGLDKYFMRENITKTIFNITAKTSALSGILFLLYKDKKAVFCIWMKQDDDHAEKIYLVASQLFKVAGISELTNY